MGKGLIEWGVLGIRGSDHHRSPGNACLDGSRFSGSQTVLDRGPPADDCLQQLRTRDQLLRLNCDSSQPRAALLALVKPLIFFCGKRKRSEFMTFLSHNFFF
jgi:hypothetical protein